MEHEAQEKKGVNCEVCEDSPGSIQCKDCSGYHAWCHHCAVSVHRHLPFHRLEVWTGSCYKEIPLHQLGYIWYMGHGGDPCPLIAKWENEGFGSDDDPFTEPKKTRSDIGPALKITVVHCSGIFTHAVSWCQSWLFPASTIQPETAITLEVLEDFHLENLECKSSVAAFYSKLKRKTNYPCPHVVLVSSHQCLLCRAGFAHDKQKIPKQGDNAVFFPACPQAKCLFRWLVQLPYVVDGNFTVQHMNMKAPEDDVHLSNACNSAGGLRNLWFTGIGACACAQHGCFVPYSVVDFQKGEQYMNIDYSICNAIGYKSGNIEACLLIYDIACQWLRNFLRWVLNSGHLEVPKGMKIIPAVGKVHISAHRMELDGEILETLWAPLNKVAPSTRAMSAAH
ncbi:hypothetical protein V8B97DRAFT_2022191 [Scleroderma yunnanense]